MIDIKKVYPLQSWERAKGISDNEQQHISRSFLDQPFEKAGLLPLENGQ